MQIDIKLYQEAKKKKNSSKAFACLSAFIK